MSLTQTQVELARHALGLNNRKRSYRNYFVCGPGHSDFDAWQAMVRDGLAKTRQGNAITGGESVFWLMLHAAESVLRKGETLDLKDFPKSLRAEDMEAAT